LEKNKHILSWKNIFLLIVGILLLATFLLATSDLKAVLVFMVSANKTFYCLAFFLLILGVVAYTASWYLIVKAVNLNFSFKFALMVTWSSIFFNLMIPTASLGGEFFRIYVVNRKSGVDYGTITLTVFLHRILCTLPFVTGSIIGFIYLAYFHELPYFLSNVLMLVLAVIGVSLIFALIVSVKPKILTKISSFLPKFLGGRFYRLNQKLVDATFKFEEGFKLLKVRKKIFVASLILAFVSWFFDVMVAYFVFISLNNPLGFPIIVSVYTIGMTIQMVPIGIPGMVGVVESAMSTLYMAAGVSTNLSVAATLMIRIIMLWFQVLVGGILTLKLREF